MEGMGDCDFFERLLVIWPALELEPATWLGFQGRPYNKGTLEEATMTYTFHAGHFWRLVPCARAPRRTEW